MSFAYIEGESFLMSMKVCDNGRDSWVNPLSTRPQTTALSSGSACTSASLEPSYVLRALGASDDIAHSSIRFGIGRFTTEEEVDYVVRETIKTVTRLRELRWVFPSTLGCDRRLTYWAVLYGRWCRRELTSVRSTGRNIEPDLHTSGSPGCSAEGVC